MKKTTLALGSALFLISATSLLGKELILNAVQYPEDRKVPVEFSTSAFGAGAQLGGKVEYVKGQSRITLDARDLGPAVLHGGDVAAYVLWALTRTGSVENLGELWVWQGDEKVRYTSGLKELALLVTAETHPLVDRPSELVVFHSLEVDRRGAATTPFSFRDFAPAPAYDKDSIANLEYKGVKPLYVIQAERVFELGRERGAETHAEELYRDAQVTLSQARNLAEASKQDLSLDYARRSLALSSEALRLLERQREAAALEARILERREDVRQLDNERQELERQVAELETEKSIVEASYQALQRDQLALERKQQELEREQQELEREHSSLEREHSSLVREHSSLEHEKVALEAHTERLRNTTVRLQNDKESLEKNLGDALSEIADTRSTARGLIVTLPDILFDVDEATLKPEARSTLAKLAGVLLLVPGVELEIEGHTDATGTETHNLDLSHRRAGAVESFLAAEGVARERMSARGFGEEHPVAANDTSAGREKNRRVEVILPRSEPASAATHETSAMTHESRKGAEP